MSSVTATPTAVPQAVTLASLWNFATSRTNHESRSYSGKDRVHGATLGGNRDDLVSDDFCPLRHIRYA
jgi:hypothetical protein